jgi:alanine racemase
MDMIVVDVTDIPDVKVGSIATLIGTDRKEEIKARELAEFSATTHYEIVTRLNPLMRKVYK